MMKLRLRDRIKLFSYKAFGRYVPDFQSFKQVYQKSGISLLYESYLAVMFFSLLFAFALTFAVSAVVHVVLFRLSFVQVIVAVLALSSVATSLVLMAFMLVPVMRMRQRRAETEANLVYTIGYMGVLSAGGISIERIFNRVVEVEPRKAIKDLARRVIADVRMFGFDVASALEDAKVHSPSDVFAKLLVGVVNTIKTSGDLKSLLVFETNRLLTLKREQLKKTLAALIALAEIYVTAMVMAPITFIVMLTILSVLGTTQFGLSPATQLNLIVFFGLPVICIVFIVILDGVLPREE